jgi:hypothetical protein
MTYEQLAKEIKEMTPAQRKRKVLALSQCGNFVLDVDLNIIDKEAVGLYDCFERSDMNRPVLVLS